MSNENIFFDDVGIYEILVSNNNFHKYRIMYKFPKISNDEFKSIVDDLIIKCNYDIDFVVRELEKIGFKKLTLDGLSEYRFI